MARGFPPVFFLSSDTSVNNMNLWGMFILHRTISHLLLGVSVESGKPGVVDVPYDRNFLVITRAALSGTATGPTVLSLKRGDDQFVLGTFRAGVVDQMELDIKIDQDDPFAGGYDSSEEEADSPVPVSFVTTGPNQVHVTGYFNSIQMESYDSDETDSYEGPFNLEGLISLQISFDSPN